MAYIGQLIGALTSTTLGRSAPPPRRSRPTRRHGELASRTVAVCTALAIAVTLAVAAGFASSAVALPAHGPTINGTAETTAAPTHGPTINGTAETTAQPSPKDSAANGDDTPWVLAAIGACLALGAIGVGISRRPSHRRTSPAAPSV